MGSIPTPGMSRAPRATASRLMSAPSAFTAAAVCWVALGGALGSVLRFGLGEAARRLLGSAGIPWGTLAVNVLGSFVLGYFTRWALQHEATPALRAFVAIGLCGGFTTFSTFALEHYALVQDGAFVRAGFYTLLSLVLTLAAVAAGFALARS